MDNHDSWSEMLIAGSQLHARLAVVGATGHLGRKILEALAEYKYPVEKVVATSLKNTSVSYGPHHVLNVLQIGNLDFASVDIVIFALPTAVTDKYIKDALNKGCVVINAIWTCDNKQNAPVVVATINPTDVKLSEKSRVLVNPDAISTIILKALYPIHKTNPIKRIVAATYQSVSDLGKKAMDELYSQTKQGYAGPSLSNSNHKKYPVLPKPIPFNCIPHIGEFTQSGATTEEERVAHNIKAVLGSKIQICVTCVHVPVFVGHSIALNVEFQDPINTKLAEEILENYEGLGVINVKNKNQYFTPIDCVQEELIFISRLRQDMSVKNGLSMWVVADNIRISALNVAQILGLLLKQHQFTR